MEVKDTGNIEESDKSIKFEKFIIKFFYASLGIGISGILLVIFTYMIWGHFSFVRDVNFTKIGTFGDFIGGFIGTIFTIAATLLIWLTYNSQKRELAKSIEISKNQYSSLKIQKFENTFFNLLSLHNQNLNHLSTISIVQAPNQSKIPTTNPEKIRIELKGRDCIKKLYDRLKKIYIEKKTSLEMTKRNSNANPDQRIEIQKEILEQIYIGYYNTYQGDLEHYFKTINQILIFVHTNGELTRTERKKYIQFLKSQLSYYELLQIFYQYKVEYSVIKKDLIEEYGILDKLNKRELLDIHHF